jgi:hypothetical protein
VESQTGGQHEKQLLNLGNEKIKRHKKKFKEKK